MSVHLDSSALVKLYFPEMDSAAVTKYVETLANAIPFSPLHELELKNAFRLKVFRGEGELEQVEESIRLIDEDVASGILTRPVLNWSQVFRGAEELSKRSTSVIGSRTLDLLHIATAFELRVRSFLTFDEKQAKAASRAGLTLVSI